MLRLYVEIYLPLKIPMTARRIFCGASRLCGACFFSSLTNM
jgi:hypothetical protein